MLLKKVIFKDQRTDTIFGVPFVRGESTEFVGNDFIKKLREVGDGCPFTVLEENYEKTEKKNPVGRQPKE